MSSLYIAEPGLYLEKDGNRFVIKRKAEKIKEVPLEKITNIVLMGKSYITSPLVVELLEREIPVTWLSFTGKFFGRLETTSNINIERQREQFRRGDDENFCLALSKSFTTGKIKNSRVVLRRYNRNKMNPEIENILLEMKDYCRKIDNAESINEIMGYEGNASRIYFKGLSLLVSDNFKFQGRNRQPPRDRFNSLLSFGYTLLMYELYTAIVNRGLHPYAGFLHRIRKGHPALASDMMEEWRPIVVDSMVMNIALNDIYKPHDFIESEETGGGVYLDGITGKDFVRRFEHKIGYSANVLPYIDYSTNFRESIQLQAGSIAKAVEQNDPGLYRPASIR